MPEILLSRSWLALTIPAVIAGLALLAFAILLLLRAVRTKELARVPLSPTAEIDLREAGPVSFFVDKPRYRNVQARLLTAFALSVTLEDAGGRRMEAARPLVPLSTKGVSRVRAEIANLAEVEPGRYRVRIAGLSADVGDAGAFLIVARPISKAVFVAGILAIIAASLLAIGGFIASLATFVPFHRG